jgi:hypothetical protein
VSKRLCVIVRQFTGREDAVPIFDDREKGFEKKYAHDQETLFKIGARRNKLLGAWAAEQMGLTGQSAEAYAREVVASDFDEAGDEDVIRKVAADFKAKGVKVSDHRLRRQMAELLEVARKQITGQP